MLDPFVYSADAIRVVFGRGAAKRLGEEAAFHKMSRVMVLCSSTRAAYAEEITASLGAARVGICPAAVPSMPPSVIDTILADLKKYNADGFVCIGGGSPLGLAKAAAAMSGLPYIAVVTTYSGSEMAARWYLGTGQDERRGDAPLASTVIYDPDLTLDLPFKTSVASCMNAMAHAVESLYGHDANPITTALSEEAVRRLGSAIARMKSDPRDIDARTDALYGAWLAAYFRASVSLEHIIAQRVRQNFGTEHAQTHAATLPYVVAFNRHDIPDAIDRLKRALGTEDPAQALYEINAGCGLATGFSQLGMREEDIPRAADIVMEHKFKNPRPASRADVENVICQAWAGRPPQF
jgi:maleylacetate reductase